MSKQKKVKSFQDLRYLKQDLNSKLSKDEYQSQWRDNKRKFREMIAKKNKKWLDANKDESKFEYYKEFPKVYERIEKIFSEKKSRNFLIHTISNFFPLNRCQQVPRLPEKRNTCDISDFKITDLDSIITDKNNARDKHIAYTGENTNVLLCGIAVQELERFVYKYVKDFDCPYGHIINHALDKKRNEK